MVVVAIIAIITAIAVPTYTSFREGAQKTVYKADLISLHKSWITFSTEKDSFLRRLTAPTQASIETVGMRYLFYSDNYGNKVDVDNKNFIGFAATGISGLTKYDSGGYGTDARSTVLILFLKIMMP